MSENNQKLRIAIPVPPEDRYPNYFYIMEELGAEGIKYALTDDPDDFDGMLIPGGDDVDPLRYNQQRIACGEIDEKLDELQFEAVAKFMHAGKPIFGICRGHQLLNVYFGGTLIQDITSGSIHDWDTGCREDKVHYNKAKEKTWISELYGEYFPTNSAHHEAVDRVGDRLVVDQYSEDGLVEAMHCVDAPVYSVQWHPERMCFKYHRDDTVDGSVILKWFLNQCMLFKNRL